MSSMSITIAADGVSQQRVTDTTTTGLDLFGDDRTIVAVRVNGELWDLNRTLPEDAMVEPVAIGRLERYVGDAAIREGWANVPDIEPTR